MSALVVNDVETSEGSSEEVAVAGEAVPMSCEEVHRCGECGAKKRKRANKEGPKKPLTEKQLESLKKARAALARTRALKKEAAATFRAELRAVRNLQVEGKEEDEDERDSKAPRLE